MIGDLLSGICSGIKFTALILCSGVSGSARLFKFKNICIVNCTFRFSTSEIEYCVVRGSSKYLLSGI